MSNMSDTSAQCDSLILFRRSNIKVGVSNTQQGYEDSDGDNKLVLQDIEIDIDTDNVLKDNITKVSYGNDNTKIKGAGCEKSNPLPQNTETDQNDQTLIKDEQPVNTKKSATDARAETLLEAIENLDLNSLSSFNIQWYDETVDVRLNQYDTCYSTIMLASYYGFTECLWSLISLGVNLYKLSIIYKRSLLLAASRGHELCIRFLARYALFKSDIKDAILSKIVLAIGNQEFDYVQELLSQVPDDCKWVKGIEGCNVMNLLVFNGSWLDCIQSMIDKGAKINQLDGHGIPPLGAAVIAGNVEHVHFFLSRGADVNLCDDQKRYENSFTDFSNFDHFRKENRKKDLIYGYGQTALMFAAILDRAECADLLLKHGADVNAADEGGLTALMHAAYHKNHKCVKTILNFKEKLQINTGDERKQSALLHAAYAGDTKSAQLLLKAGANRHMLDADGRNASMAALISNDRECASTLLKFPQEIYAKDKRGLTSLFYVAEQGNSDMLTFLLEKAKIPIHLNKAAVKIFLEAPLFCAIRVGAIECVKVLVKNGVNINCRDSYDKTPLMEACESKCTDIFFFLVKHGAKIKVIDKKKSERNMLMWAMDCDIICFEYLLQKGVNVNYAKEVDEETVLMMACKKGNATILKLLIDHGADVNYFGKTKRPAPLMCAAYEGHFECFVLLLDAGANVDYMCYGRTVLLCVLSSDRLPFLEVLINQGNLFKDSKLKKVHAKSISRDISISGFSYTPKVIIAMMNLGMFSWSWYSYVETYRLLFSCVVSGISPGLFLAYKPKNLRFSLNNMRSKEAIYTTNNKVSPLLTAMLKIQPHIVCYLMSNFYFTVEDYRTIICNIEFQKEVRQNVNDEMDSPSVYYHETSEYSSGRCPDILSILGYITTNPLSLQTLSFLTVSTSISFNGQSHSSIARAEHVDSLPIPELFKRRLKFQGPLAKLCPNYWHCIMRAPPGCDSYSLYHKLLSFSTPVFPYLKRLVPCPSSHCRRCEGLGMVFIGEKVYGLKNWNL